ncbi:disease resistance protein RPM1-like [Phoenix dactylifera]|uniref:Disease resistance protein RPM1-like n=1 Tax=Phoenix dactylifera TaxID=42345 RepID=A0A8B9A0X7_PHODC|nr:disease resistance protein RPM1-like [Phoenix dactylifera]XP_038977467.1 disease resistance protein RPM1-like [Phoenix dactylifera]XP_038977468.1 disease resistance protein RPM1-like [Phoenix dactylifera]XP_038977469.1 disease resistance protein RPM1-like [Phoenix dactylifera]XP_038977470.1 disease resistance protein RPM1-like [Phoenix dactylifera]XP_038977471.1 disease resistance protein RPM1-like [Phoenix dactylifera]
MAEAAVLLAVQKIGFALGGEALKKARSLFANEVSLLTQLPSSMSRIRSELLVMQAFLGQIDTRTDSNQVLDAWVQEVRKLAYSVEDIMDEYVYLIAQQQGSGLGGCLSKVVRRSQNLVAFHQIAAQLKELETNLVHLSQMKERWIKTTEGAMGGSSRNASEKQQNLADSSRFMDEDDLVGIDQNKKKLTEWLLDEDPVGSIISVWGMGGLGKTTLVTNVYKSERKEFQCHAWVSISQTYEVDDLLRRMIKELYENEKVEKISNDIREMDHIKLVERVRSWLEKKKYLIVLDDVWDIKAFNAISDAINVDDNNGSRVIITTRIAEVASLAHDSRKLELKVLESTEAWDLFCRRAFRKDKVRRCPKELEELGKKIVLKCQGLPLAIVSLGSLLSLREKTKSEWEKVYDRLSWELNNNPNLDNVKHVLNLSYNYLPRYLKNCFLHCSMFPEDHVLQRKRLMRLWVAEGFVEERGSSTIEEVAEDYLKELIHRCMLQVVERNQFGRIKHCRMHDLVRELAVPLSKKENFSAVLDDLQMVGKTGNETRRLSVHNYSNEIQSSMELPRLHTFMVFDRSMSSSSSFLSLCSSSRYLTVLDLQGISIERVPDEIGDFFNLRFLGLRDTKVKVLPKSLGRLRNLQTLDLMNSEIEKLPSTTRNLKKLRHLFAEKILDPNCNTINGRRGVRVSKGLWNLKDLQTLQAVEANMEFVKRLGNLTQLRSIRIWKVSGIHCKDLCASLSRLRYLSYLSLNASNENEILQLGGWDHPPQHLPKLDLNGRLAEGTMELPLFRALGASLQNLYLRRSGLAEDPIQSLSQLTNLRVLILQKAYDGQRLWFGTGCFPNLKQLLLDDMPQLNQVEVEDGAMARLEVLVMDALPALKDVPRGIEYLTSLQELYLKDLHPEFRGRFQESDDKNKIQRIPVAYYVFQRGDETKYEKLS